MTTFLVLCFHLSVEHQVALCVNNVSVLANLFFLRISTTILFSCSSLPCPKPTRRNDGVYHAISAFTRFSEVQSSRFGPLSNAVMERVVFRAGHIRTQSTLLFHAGRNL